MANLSINSVTLTIVAVATGLILIGSLLAPIATDIMSDLNEIGGDAATWANMVGVTVVMSILGLVIVCVNSYTKK